MAVGACHWTCTARRPGSFARSRLTACLLCLASTGTLAGGCKHVHSPPALADLLGQSTSQPRKRMQPASRGRAAAGSKPNNQFILAGGRATDLTTR
jgi:hypothetical protein